MPTFTSFRASVAVALFSASLPIAGCSCDDGGDASPAPVECVPQDETLSAAAPMTNSTLVPGTMHASFSVNESGQPVVHVPIDVAAGRGAPTLALATVAMDVQFALLVHSRFLDASCGGMAVQRARYCNSRLGVHPQTCGARTRHAA